MSLCVVNRRRKAGETKDSGAFECQSVGACWSDVEREASAEGSYKDL